MGLRPDFRVSVDGSDRSDVLRGLLTRLRVTSSTGTEADEVELEFDDRGGAIVLPPHGAVIALSLGYVGGALVDQGRFTVDETELTGPPDALTVRGKSSDMRQGLKAQKSRAWSGTTTNAIVAQIAGENGLQPVVHPALSGIAVAHRDQTNESDVHFLTRLGRDHDAVAAVKGGKLILAPQGQAVSASGKALATLTLGRSDLTSWRATIADRDKQGSVKAAYRTNTAAAIAYVTAGADAPVRTLKHIHPSAEVAGRAAHAEHRRGKRAAHGVELVLPGRPEAAAGSPVVLSGVRTGIDGAWIGYKVEHEADFGSGGFRTTLNVSVDGLDADSAGDGTPAYGGDDADPAQSADGQSE